MPTFSRWMPAGTKPMSTAAGWLLFLAIISPLLIGAAFTRGGKYVLAFLIVVWVLGELESRRRLRQLAAERAREDIGTFARAFDRRGEPFSPHVARGVWDALGPYVLLNGSRVAVRPTDRIDEDLGIDWDDVDLILSEVAKRTGHSLEGVEANPWYSRANTVGDLVRLLSAQPRCPAA